MTPPAESVLVVEDSESNLELIQETLDGTGLELATARTVAAARSWLGSNVPGLILMDIDLPDGSGLDLTRQIRSDPRLTGVRVIALTANAMAGFEKEVLAAGCDDYLTKPVDLRLLLRRVLARP